MTAERFLGILPLLATLFIAAGLLSFAERGGPRRLWAAGGLIATAGFFLLLGTWYREKNGSGESLLAALFVAAAVVLAMLLTVRLLAHARVGPLLQIPAAGIIGGVALVGANVVLLFTGFIWI
jgi:hypothetical protein